MYKTGSWGEQAIARSARRTKYFRERKRKLARLKGVKESLGRIGEDEAQVILNTAEKLHLKDLADFLWRDKYVDVKTAILSDNHGSPGWLFYCKKQKGKIDYFFCIAKDKDKKTKYVFLVPDRAFMTNSLWISMKNIEKFLRYLWRGGVEGK